MTSTCPLSPRKMALGPSPFRASWRAKLQGVPPCSSWKIRSGVGNGHAARREGMGTGRWAGWHTAAPGLLPGLSSGVGGERREVTRGNKKRKVQGKGQEYSGERGPEAHKGQEAERKGCSTTAWVSKETSLIKKLGFLVPTLPRALEFRCLQEDDCYWAASPRLRCRGTEGSEGHQESSLRMLYSQHMG